MLSPLLFSSTSFCFWFLSCSADPYSVLINQMTAISLRQSEDTEKILADQEEFRNTLAYVCSSHCYYQACVNYSFAQHEWPQPMPTGYTRRLLADGPPFEPWVVPTEPISVYHLVIDEPDAPLFIVDEDFILDEWVVPCFSPFLCWQKRREEAGES